MYTTLSPCDMCTGACLLYGISRVVVGENANFLGGEAYLRSRGVEVVVVSDARCKELMDKFIAEKPDLWWVISSPLLRPPPTQLFALHLDQLCCVSDFSCAMSDDFCVRLTCFTSGMRISGWRKGFIPRSDSISEWLPSTCMSRLNAKYGMFFSKGF